MKILGLSGSPRKDGNTDAMVVMTLEGARQAGAETSFFNLSQLNIMGCQGCLYCRTKPGCAIKDDMSKLYKEIEDADAVVIGSPVYMFQMTSQTKAFMDRLFPFLNPDFSSKINKAALLLFAQGNPDKDVFKAYFAHISNAYKLLGLHVKNVLVEGGTSAKNDAAGRSGLRDALYAAGKSLAAK